MFLMYNNAETELKGIIGAYSGFDEMVTHLMRHIIQGSCVHDITHMGFRRSYPHEFTGAKRRRRLLQQTFCIIELCAKRISLSVPV